MEAPDYSNYYYFALERALESGALIIAAAGNEFSNNEITPKTPCSFNLPGIVCVGSSTPDDWKSDFSNWGSSGVDLFAPGTKILSAGHLTDSSYVTMSGTSMATPLVAGVVSAYWARDPDLSAADVKQDLMESVDLLPENRGLISVTGGRMNMGSIFGVSRSSGRNSAKGTDITAEGKTKSIDDLALEVDSDTSTSEPFNPDSTFLKLKDIASLDREQLTGKFIAVMKGGVKRRSNNINEILTNRLKDEHWLDALEEFTPMRDLGNGLAVFDLAERPDVDRREVLRRLIETDWFLGIEPDREFSVPLPIPSDSPNTIPAVRWIGTRQSDELTGATGNDVLHGEDGDDVIYGFDGDDQIQGGRGDDVLIGGAGDDELRGGKGSDLFHFGEGRDVVRGFNPAKGDQVVIPTGVDVSIETINNGVLITDGNAQEMVIMRMDKKSFLSSDPFA